VLVAQFSSLVFSQSLRVTFLHYEDFDHNGELANNDNGEESQAPGERATVLIKHPLLVEGLNLRSCRYYVSNYPPATARHV